MQHWDEIERRNPAKERRISSERRYAAERRFDFRESQPLVRRSVKAWVRSFTNARLGVDRRKGVERRMVDRRSEELRSLLTPEEIADLMK